MRLNSVIVYFIVAALNISFILLLQTETKAQSTQSELSLSLTGQAIVRSEYTLEIYAGNINSFSNLHGISFRIQIKSPNSRFIKESVGFGPFLGSGVLSLQHLINDQTKDIAITRTNGVGQQGRGLLGWVNATSDFVGDVVFEIVDLKAVNPNGSIIPVEGKSITIPVKMNTNLSKDKVVPISFNLFPNYPNPFNPSTTLHFELLTPDKIELTVYEITGRIVHSSVLGFYNAGVHHVVFDASKLNSGVYVYKITAGNRYLTSTMSLLK